MDSRRPWSPAATALVQLWLTVLPLVVLVLLSPTSTREAPLESFGTVSGTSGEFVVVLETHPSVAVAAALLGVSAVLTAVVLTARGSGADVLRRLSVRGRVALVAVAVVGAAFASMPVQAHLLGWDRGDLPAPTPWWSNTTVTQLELH